MCHLFAQDSGRLISLQEFYILVVTLQGSLFLQNHALALSNLGSRWLFRVRFNWSVRVLVCHWLSHGGQRVSLIYHVVVIVLLHDVDVPLVGDSLAAQTILV